MEMTHSMMNVDLRQISAQITIQIMNSDSKWN